MIFLTFIYFVFFNLIPRRNFPHYGGEITNDEWKDSSIRKYIIFRKMSYVGRCEAYSNSEFLAFHTAEQRDEFLKNNEQLVKDYLMIE